MRLIARAAALLGAAAHAVEVVARGLFWFAPARWPWALGVALMLGLAAWQSIDGARRAEAAQPRPEPVPLAAVVEGEAGWVGTASIVEGPFLDSSVYGAPILRYYYLLTDPDDESVAMIARSPERLEERSTRTIVARVEADPEAIERAAGQRGVDPDRYLVELPDRPTALIGAVQTPETLSAEPDAVVTFRADFTALGPTPDGQAWEYVAREGGRALVVRSSHAPEALPVDVWGVAATDPVRVEQALAVPELQEALGGRQVPTSRLLAEGVSPPVAEPSYLGAIVFAALAMLLATGWALGYPIFRRRPLPQRVATWTIGLEDELPAEVYGIDARSGERVGLDAAPATLERMRADELERRAWQFALQEAGAAPQSTRADGSERAALALSSGQGPLLLRLEPAPAGLELVGGELVEASRARPALRLRAPNLDLSIAFESTADRDRALAAMDPPRLGSLLPGPPPRRPAARLTDPAVRETPRAVRAAAIIVGAVAALVIAAALAGLPGMLADPSHAAPVGAQLAIGAGLAAVARGIWLRRDWAGTVGFNVAWVGAAVAAFVAVAAPQCGLWLSPNLAACQAAGPAGVAAAIASAVALACAALALARNPRAFTR